MNSRKFISRILHSPGPNALESRRHTPLHRTGPPYILWCWIDMRDRGCIRAYRSRPSLSRTLRLASTVAASTEAWAFSRQCLIITAGLC
jgi:hypothetical protein